MRKNKNEKLKSFVSWKKVAKCWEDFKKKYEFKIWPSALKKLEEYLGYSKVCVTDDMLLMYARCLIGCGKRTKALEVLDIIEKSILNINNRNAIDIEKKQDGQMPRGDRLENHKKWRIAVLKEMAELYAICSCESDVRRILADLEAKTSLDSTFYFYLARSCNYNGLLALALELFEISSQKNISDQKLSAKNCDLLAECMEKIKLCMQYPDEFAECTYGHFLAEGKSLCPGHIIIPQFLLKKNNGWSKYCDALKTRPFMIWKIERDFLYCFPLTIDLDSGQFTFKKENYPVKGVDRRLKDSVYVIERKHVLNVCGIISPEDFSNSIEMMNTCLCHTQKGSWEDGSKYFMSDMKKKRQAFVGDIILMEGVDKDSPRYYFITGVDLKLKEYCAVEVESRDYTLVSNSSIGISWSHPNIMATFRIGDSVKRDEALKMHKIISNDGSAIGVVFLHNGRRLEVMKETSKSYVCMDVTDGEYPIDIKIIDVPKGQKLNIISRVSASVMDAQFGRFNDKVHRIKNSFDNCNLRSKPLFEGKARLKKK